MEQQGRRQHLPLPKDYFTPPTYSEDQIQKCTQNCMEHVKSLFKNIQQDSNIHWLPTIKKDDVYYYKGTPYAEGGGAGRSDKPMSFLRCVGSVDATVSELMDISVSTNTEEFQHQSRIGFGDSFLDGQVIKNILGSSSSQPRTSSTSSHNSTSFNHPYYSITFKWIALKAGSAFTRPRDFVFVEVTNMYEEEDGTVIGYRVLESIALKSSDVPSLESSHNIVRGEIHRTGYIYRNKGGNGSETKVLHMNAVDPFIGSSTAVKKSAGLWGNVINNLRSYFERQQVNRDTIVPKSLYVPQNSVKNCSRCKETFTSKLFFSQKKYNCECCGAVVCSNCNEKKEVDIPGIGIKVLRVCDGCTLTSQARRSLKSDDGGASSSKSCSSGNESSINRRRRRKSTSAASVTGTRKKKNYWVDDRSSTAGSSGSSGRKTELSSGGSRSSKGGVCLLTEAEKEKYKGSNVAVVPQSPVIDAKRARYRTMSLEEVDGALNELLLQTKPTKNRNLKNEHRTTITTSEKITLHHQTVTTTTVPPNA